MEMSPIVPAQQKISENDQLLQPKTKSVIRRAMVKRGVCRGLSIPEIVSELAKRGIFVSEKTVDRDIRLVRERVLEELKNNDQSLHSILADFSLRSDEIFKNLWSIYFGFCENKDRINALRVLNETIIEKVKILQGLGVGQRQMVSMKSEQVTVEWQKSIVKDHQLENQTILENSV